MEGSSACNEVAPVVKSPNAVVLDALTVSEREREGVLLTRAGPDKESATWVAGDEQPFLCLCSSHVTKVPAKKAKRRDAHNVQVHNVVGQANDGVILRNK